ncbi:hypothetical protein MKK70_22285 [Methylobacterium sp. E-041]|uniref:hypothetical protein n=1 Tax=Methylobacterium sp. E-041 TaxID=2836573 RepID=UPI001FB8A383|nr:hypothetical protein [Methylobacterium sp. E-041]MCJ2108053.1 hypothetical protein [Methylobacterium sp. E-041]
MQITLVHEPSAGRLPYILRCLCGGCEVSLGFADQASAEAARPEFSAAMREAFRS